MIIIFWYSKDDDTLLGERPNIKLNYGVRPNIKFGMMRFLSSDVTFLTTILWQILLKNWQNGIFNVRQWWANWPNYLVMFSSLLFNIRSPSTQTVDKVRVSTVSTHTWCQYFLAWLFLWAMKYQNIFKPIQNQAFWCIGSFYL